MICSRKILGLTDYSGNSLILLLVAAIAVGDAVFQAPVMPQTPDQLAISQA
jgi:hypothetical protein